MKKYSKNYKLIGIFLFKVELANAQFKGLWEGYNMISDQPLELADFFIINADGQISELIVAFSEENLKRVSQEDGDTLLQLGMKTHRFNKKEFFKKNNVKNAREYWHQKLKHSRCSALVKVVKTDNGKKIFKTKK